MKCVQDSKLKEVRTDIVQSIIKIQYICDKIGGKKKFSGVEIGLLKKLLVPSFHAHSSQLNCLIYVLKNAIKKNVNYLTHEIEQTIKIVEIICEQIETNYIEVKERFEKNSIDWHIKKMPTEYKK
jgi:hypothetical protein